MSTYQANVESGSTSEQTKVVHTINAATPSAAVTTLPPTGQQYPIKK
jgi:hypothetical protein